MTNRGSFLYSFHWETSKCTLEWRCVVTKEVFYSHLLDLIDHEIRCHLHCTICMTISRLACLLMAIRKLSPSILHSSMCV